MRSNSFVSLSVAVGLIASCKTTSDGSGMKNQTLRQNQTTQIIAQSALSFDVNMLKTHLANAIDPSLPKLGLWAAFLEESQQDSPCPGKVLESYYMLDTSTDEPAETVYVTTAKPMPMNGPCGLVIDTEVKNFNQVSRALMESSPLAQIGTFDKIKFTIKEAIDRSEANNKNFKYRDGVKIYRHLHPTTWDHPWYAIYGTACGIDSTVYFNAENAEIIDMLDSPIVGPCPPRN
jgi:hypothetical protein